MNIFALCGQSNMSGTATIPTYQTTSHNIQTWRNGWVSALESIHNNSYAGPALPFALSLLQLMGKDYLIGLVPCAVGGSSITHWQRGQGIYQDAVNKVNAALATQPGVTLAGVLFAQGEADTFSVAEAEAWPGLALQFARDFRTDTGKLEVPFLYAQLGADPNDPARVAWALLRDTHQPTLCDPSRPYVRMIKTLDIPNTAQHFADAEAYAVVGRRFAASYFVNFP